MSAQPHILTFPAVGAQAVLHSALMNETLRDLREAVLRRKAIHYGDGSAPVLAIHAVSDAGIGDPQAEKLSELTAQAAIAGDAFVAPMYRAWLDYVLWLCAEQLVERMAEGQRITFGPLQ